MQNRHTDRKLYFNELAATCRKYFIPYILAERYVGNGTDVLEIGCGDGGNMLPFAELGCNVTGVDISSEKIESAGRMFAENGTEGIFIVQDIFKVNSDKKFDVILCHDVIEHIEDKAGLMSWVQSHLKSDGVVFMAFPPWQMPFGGHQQMCRSGILSHLPYIHLLPSCIYGFVLKAFGESKACVDELLSIKRTGTSIECFETLLRQNDLSIRNRKLWFVNPHYETKFGLKPRELNRFIARIPYLRNFLGTGCFYLVKNS